MMIKLQFLPECNPVQEGYKTISRKKTGMRIAFINHCPAVYDTMYIIQIHACNGF